MYVNYCATKNNVQSLTGYFLLYNKFNKIQFLRIIIYNRDNTSHFLKEEKLLKSL